MKEGFWVVVVLFIALCIWGAILEIKEWWQGGVYNTIEILEETHLCGSISRDYDVSYRGYSGSSSGSSGESVILIKKIQYIFNKSEDNKYERRPDKLFLETADYEVIKEAYEIDEAYGNYIFVPLGIKNNWLSSEKEKDLLGDKVRDWPDYYRQISADEFAAFYCDEGLTEHALEMDKEDCEIEIHKGDFKKKLLEEYSSSTCTRINTDGIYEYFASQQETLDDYERQLTAKSVFGDAYESDYSSIENTYEVLKDYEEWKDNN